VTLGKIILDQGEEMFRDLLKIIDPKNVAVGVAPCNIFGFYMEHFSLAFLTALCSQTKRFFESVALQHFQKISCGSFDR
jgi:hypothetical protein